MHRSCVQTTDGWTKTRQLKPAKNFWIGKMTFWAMSSLMMSHDWNKAVIKSPCPKTFCQSKSKIKTMLLTFLILTELSTTPRATIILLPRMLERLHEKVRQTNVRTFSQKVLNSVHHNNALVHTTLCHRDLANKQITMLECPP